MRRDSGSHRLLRLISASALLVASLSGWTHGKEIVDSHATPLVPHATALDSHAPPLAPHSTIQDSHSTTIGSHSTDSHSTQKRFFDEERLRLTSAYCSNHYGTASWQLTEPRMVVVHYTAIPTLEATLRFFQPSLLDRKSRHDIASGGEVNVSAHYVVDKNGALFQLAGEDVICRHTIGYNYTAIGIENVAGRSSELTEAQARATAELVSRIVARHPSIDYMIGHHEYRDRTLPHYQLMREKDNSYRFTDKTDPGPVFMTRVRTLLRDQYGIRLKE